MGQLVVIMGVSGCGKSTLGRRLARIPGAIYLEGDDLHPPGNIEKMSSGVPLEDEDRWPWFDRIIEATKRQIDSHSYVFVGCSALKEKYREYLLRDFPDGRIIFLSGPFEVILDRMNQREHFMPAGLLRSQFETLEDPDEARCLVLSIMEPVDELVDQAEHWILR